MTKAKKIQISTDIFESELMNSIKGEFGVMGMTIALQIQMMIQAEGYYLKWNRATRTRIMGILPGADSNLINSVIDALIEYKVIDGKMFRSQSVMTSREVQIAYFRKKSNQALFDSNPDYLVITDADLDLVTRKERPLEEIVLAKWNARCVPELRKDKIGQYCEHSIEKLLSRHKPERARQIVYGRLKDAPLCDFTSWTQHLLAS